jgi:phage terminase large subunit
VTYDSIGVGAFAGSHFQALNDELGVAVAWSGFNAGSGVVNPDARIDSRDPQSKANKDFYANLKAQAWWSVAARFRNTFNYVERGVVCAPDEMIAIDSGVQHLDRLIDELCTPRRDFDAAGRAKVESKKDLARRDVPSPNLADAFVMAFAPQEVRSHYSLQGV